MDKKQKLVVDSLVGNNIDSEEALQEICDDNIEGAALQILPMIDNENIANVGGLDRGGIVVRDLQQEPINNVFVAATYKNLCVQEEASEENNGKVSI
jgi:hypothetical protein